MRGRNKNSQKMNCLSNSKEVLSVSLKLISFQSVEGSQRSRNVMSQTEDYHIQLLIDKYLSGQASEEEIKLVEEWYASFESAPGLVQQLDEKEVEEARTNSFRSVLDRLGLKDN